MAYFVYSQQLDLGREFQLESEAMAYAVAINENYPEADVWIDYTYKVEKETGDKQ